MLIAHRHGGVVLALGGYVLACTFLRLGLLARSAGEVEGLGTWLPVSLLAGWIFDLGAGLLAAIPGVLLFAMVPASWFPTRAFRWVVLALGAVTAAIVLFGIVAEWLFWDEFGVRFNFIAVDYLVYTTEVLGNIRESYPLPAILACIAVLGAAAVAIATRIGWVEAWLSAPIATGRRGLMRSVAMLVLAILPALVLSEDLLPSFANPYRLEVAKNGLWSLFAAFRANELSYERFYLTLPREVAAERMAALASVDGTRPDATPDLAREVVADGTERHLNVVQITVESLSAEFLGAWGDNRGLTPRLDALAPASLRYTRFYATGNRTDRGMEALSLSVPPTPGRSLIKRPGQEGLFTLGSVFRSRGYDTAFLYGGYGYFDNMNSFFSSNGYRVVDRASVPPDAITFANAWGACDEDLFRWTLAEADADAAAGKPFHFFVMTTSNHRPYTYPEGRIDLPPKVSGREGAVKYTDFAIGAFLDAASTRPWYKDTVFVIVADHCASSAGRTELPPDRYHIPLIIHAPGGQIPPGTIDTLCSQVDYAPTLLGLLDWSYRSRFYGRDLARLEPGTEGRALIANYQKLGLLSEDRLVVLSPRRETAVRPVSLSEGKPHAARSDADRINDAVAYYQTAAHAFAHGLHQALP